jgi:hypothetical protein
MKALLKLLKTANEARQMTHVNDHSRRCQVIQYTTWACFHLDLEGIDVDLAEIYGQNGSFLSDFVEEYDHERMHAPHMIATGCNLAFMWPGWMTGPLLHW